MIEIEIQNFQSIEKVAFKIEGFTVLVGRSNIGKSALIRAIQCALTGATGTDFVRHGLGCDRRAKGVKKCKCKASVRFKAGALDLVWEKGDADNQYTVTKDGQTVTYTAVNRGTPDFLLPDFAPVTIGDSSELIQVSEQFEPIFLLKKSGSVIADVLSDVAKLDDINGAMKLVGADRREAVSTRNVREKDVLQLRADLAQYAGLDATAQRAQDLQDRYDAIQASGQSLAYADQLLTALKGLAGAIRGLTQITGLALDGQATLRAGREFQQLQGFVSAVAERKPVIQRLMGVGNVRVPEPDGLQQGLGELLKLDAWASRYEALQAVVADLGAIPESNSPASSASSIKPLIAALRLTGKWADKHDQLRKLIVHLGERLGAADNEEALVLKAFEALGRCPTCALPLHPEHRLQAV